MVSVVLGVIVLDEDLSYRIAVGMLVVLVGVALTRWHHRPSPSADAYADVPKSSRPRPEQDVRQ